LYSGLQVSYDKAIVPKDVPENDAPKDKLLYNLKGGYLADDQQLIVSVENQLNKDKNTVATAPILNIFSLNYLYTISNALKFGFGASVEKQNVKGPELHTSTEYKVDKDTFVKTKVSLINSAVADDRDFRVAIGVKQNVTERVNVTVGADINARAVLATPGKSTLGTTKPHSFGFEVKFQ